MKIGSVLEEIDEPNSAYSYLLAKYTEIYEIGFPFKKVKINHNYRKPWLSNGLLVSVKRKNKLYKNRLAVARMYLLRLRVIVHYAAMRNLLFY